MPRAAWGDTVLAEAERTLLVGGIHYFAHFAPDAVRWEHLVDSPTSPSQGSTGLAGKRMCWTS